MTDSRLEEILAICSQLPNDPFPRYAVAMEYKNLGQINLALEAFAELQEKFPQYVAQYLQHGSMLIEQQRGAEAQVILKRGIQIAEQEKQWHALSELKQALESI